MLTFPCSTCRQAIQAADDLVGKSILCPHCGFATTVASAAITTAGALPTYPSSTGVTTADVVDAAEQARRRREADESHSPMPSVLKSGRWLSPLVTIVVVLGILTILVALLMPATRRVHVAAARTQSINNLKNIALSMHNFHDMNKRFPFNGSDLPFKDDQYQAEAIGGDFKSGSWAFQILPFIEQAHLFHAGNAKGPIPANLRNIGVSAFMCPGRGRPPFETNGGTWTDYFYNNYLNDPRQAAKPDCADARRNFNDITDGVSNTILVGHGNINTDQYKLSANVTGSSNIFRGGTTGTMRAGDNGEKTPGGVTLQRDSLNVTTVGSWGGPFPQGALMAFCDGTVRVFPYNTQNFSSFLTPTGGEEVIQPD